MGMGFWLRWGGILLGAISLFSLAQKLYSFGLVPIFNDLLSFYRAALHPVVDAVTTGLRWTLDLISIKLPLIPPDAVIVYTLFGSAFIRLFIYGNAEYKARLTKQGFHINYYDSELFGEILGGIFWPVTFIMIIIYYLITKDTDIIKTLIGSWMVEVVKVLVVSLILFGTNAYFSS
jgi:hypothetical protein